METLRVVKQKNSEAQKLGVKQSEHGHRWTSQGGGSNSSPTSW